MKGLIKNWKTTLSGIATILTGVKTIVFGEFSQGLQFIAVGVGLLFAKDHDTVN